MERRDYTGIVPPQYTGKEIEVTALLEKGDSESAKLFYNISRDRLLDVNNWHKLAGMISAKFQLIERTGDPINRKAKTGDYIRVDIPGPGPSAGNGYDWVSIEEIKDVEEEEIQSTGLRVRPAANPFGNKDETAHFYSKDATSNFIVTREGNIISAWIIDRNIKPNNEPTSTIDKIRDSAIGVTAMGIFSKIQWQGLADGLVKDDHK